MNKNTLARLSGLLICVGLILVGSPRAVSAQSDSSEVARATLRGWEEQQRLAILDRGGSSFGRTSERGILQRFNEAMDSEYDLDVISSAFSLGEDYEWYERNNGARFWSGSIDHLQLAQQGEFKASVPLGSFAAADVRFAHEESLRARRNLVLLGFRQRWSADGVQAFLVGTLKAIKPEADVELGILWARGGAEITFALAALDLFSDLIYNELEVNPSLADTALDYVSYPFTARVALDVPLSGRLRAEGYALALTPTRVVAESQTRPGDGFTQDENYAYAGGLLEWALSKGTLLGGFATWVGAGLERAALIAGRPEDDFDLTEKTWRLGLYATHRFPDRFAAEMWLARVWRTEERIRPDTTIAPNVDYEDETWAGRWSLIYRAQNGFRAEPGLDFTLREASGPAPVPTLEFLDRNHVRLRGDLGWHFGQRAFFLIGANLDLDDGSFDGAHGRFSLFW